MKKIRLSKEKKFRLRTSENLPGMNYDWATIKDGDCSAWNFTFYCWYWKELLISEFYFLWDKGTIQNKQCYPRTQVFATNIQHQVILPWYTDFYLGLCKPGGTVLKNDKLYLSRKSTGSSELLMHWHCWKAIFQEGSILCNCWAVSRVILEDTLKVM